MHHAFFSSGLCFFLQAPPVTWSMELQKEAEDWVKYLAENDKFQHSTKNPGNLYMANDRPKEYCTDAVQWFHSEEKDYNYSNPKYYKAAGHFTQVGSGAEIYKWKYRCIGCFIFGVVQLSESKDVYDMEVVKCVKRIVHKPSLENRYLFES